MNPDELLRLPTRRYGRPGSWVRTRSRNQRGVSAGLLRAALDTLIGLVAAEFVLHVDADDPGPHSARSRAAGNRLYDRVGFTEVDRLHSYRLRHTQAGARARHAVAAGYGTEQAIVAPPEPGGHDQW